jgi:hypothetical protein
VWWNAAVPLYNPWEGERGVQPGRKSPEYLYFMKFSLTRNKLASFGSKNTCFGVFRPAQ